MKSETKKTPANQPRAREVIARYIRGREVFGRNARAFCDGLAAGLSPSFYLWLDDDDEEIVNSIRPSSLYEIWDKVGQHIDDATTVVVASKHGRRVAQSEEQ